MLLYAPVMFKPVADVPRRAIVVLSPIETATTGVTAILAPAAPPSTVVPMVCAPVAFRPRLAPPVTTALSATSATVLLLTTFTPMDAPTPTLAVPPVPVTDAPAFTVLLDALPASIRTLPAPASTWVLPCRLATVLLTEVLMASAPATPTLPAPAPLFASATKSLL